MTLIDEREVMFEQERKQKIIKNIIKIIAILVFIVIVLLVYISTKDAGKLKVLVDGNEQSNLDSQLILKNEKGKILEEKAVNNSRKSIKDLIDIKQPYANLKQTDEIKKVYVEEIKINDILVVKKGEKIPVDGIVITGETMLDTSALTGESELMQIKEGDQVLSGSMNMGEIIEIKATQIAENSTVSKILELLEDATDKKTKTETIVSKISKIYTPIVIILALLIVICLPIIFNIPMLEAIHRGLTFLVISCPCAIAISVPLSYFTGIGVASKKGILIKGSNYLDALDNTKNIVFDKTGTLTNGAFTVTNIEIFDRDYTENQVIDILIKGESFSNHPIAKSIMNLKNEKVNNDDVKKYQEIEGKGITFELNDKKISIGNKLICNCEEDAILHLNIDGKHIASVFINDGIKNDAKEILQFLESNNIKMIIATSSDKTHIKKAFERLGILKYFTDIVTCSQIGKGKTSPDIYLACADKLGTAPSETLVFEDAVFAAETAHKAGFKTVGVYDESSRNDKNRIKAVCDYYADSFEKAADWGHHLLSL